MAKQLTYGEALDLANKHSQGWQCPLCKVVHSPDVKECGCESDFEKPSGTFSGGAVENLIYTNSDMKEIS